MPTFCENARKINLRPEDKTINGQCIQCGECCSNFLPMTAAEVDRVARYVAEKGIKPARHFPVVLVQQPLDMCCPFLDVNKPKEKCSIYPVRPSICRHFSCHYMTDKDAERRMLYQLSNDGWFDKASIVNVRNTFFPETRAEQ